MTSTVQSALIRRRTRSFQLQEKSLFRNNPPLRAPPPDHRGQRQWTSSSTSDRYLIFPKPGILFYDISTLLAHPRAWQTTVQRLAEALRPHQPDLLVGIESRGFLVAAPLAYELGRGFAMVRKRGKLPGGTARLTYDLEYGTDTIKIQENAITPGQRVVVLDDLVATGGTMQAAIKLVRQRGGIVAGAGCIIELTFLQGRSRVDVPFTSMVAYDS